MKKKVFFTALAFFLMLIGSGGFVNADTSDSPEIQENVAVDAEGNPYPEGGPPDLYEAIEDKQQKQEDGQNNNGLQNALAKLRRNLERALEKMGLDSEDNPDTPDTIETGDENEPDYETVAMDSEGNPYPEGGPQGLYTAIIDKQSKLANDPDNKGLQNALSRLRGNLEKNLEKRGIDRDTGGLEVGDGASEKVDKPVKLSKIDRIGKPEKPVKPEKPQRPEKPEKPEKPVKPERPERPEKPEKPEKPAKPEKPEKPNRPWK